MSEKTSRKAIFGVGVGVGVLVGIICTVLLPHIMYRRSNTTDGLFPARYHAEMLMSGDFRLGGYEMNVPYHLGRLVELDSGEAGPVLVDMLNNTSETPIIYTDEVSFEMTHMCVIIEKKGDPPTPTVVRKATIADLADWALKKVYDAPQGVGFRGDLPPAQRQEAIARWLKVILDYQLAEAEKQAKTARPVDSPGGFFPNVPASTGTPQ